MECAIEGILFAAGEPVKAAKIASVLDADLDEVKAAAARLSQSYDEGMRGLKMIEIDEGYQLCSRPEYYAYIQDILGEQRRQALSNAAMEALAIIAYKQPVTKGQVEFIRGVNSDGAVNRFSMLGTSEVKGVWLKDTREVWQRMELDEATQQLYIRTKVWGKARPLAVAATPVVAETISDDGDTGSTATEFRNGEKFYLHFRSAADGYLAVYLIDASGSVFTCLPYPSQRQNTVPVRKSADYVFFSKRRPAAVTAESDIRQYFLTAEKDMEQNRLCIVFSPNDFTLALDEKQGVSANGQQVGRYSFDDFNEALFRQRMADGRMQVVFKDIVIRKK